MSNENKNEKVEINQENQPKQKTSLEKYCDENPEAVECRMYDD